MGAVEILWMAHGDNFRALRENNKLGVRRYLTATRDFATLRVWDNQKMSDGHKS